MNDEFADAAVAAMHQEPGASSDEGGSEPSGQADPVQALAAKLSELGAATPESARDLLQRIAYMQTPQGQNEYFDTFIGSEQGAFLRKKFGQEYMADMISRNPEQVYRMAQDMGYKPPSQISEDEELAPETREMKAIKAQQAQQAALETRMQQLATGAGQKIQELEGRLKSRDDLETRTGAFREAVAGISATPMPAPAIRALAKRANDLATLYPEQYPGSIGFKRAVADAHSEFSSNAKFFQPKPGPRGTSAGGGGVAGRASVDDSKLTLAQRIEAMAEQFEADSRGRGGE